MFRVKKRRWVAVVVAVLVVGSACVAVIGGGCLAPIAAYHDGTRLTALVAADDGSWIERRSGVDPGEVAAALMPFVSV